MAYELIETVEVGSGGAASIEFTSIPQDGVDLLIVVSARTDQAINWNDASMSFNNSLTGYTAIMLYGSNTTAATTGGGPRTLRINGTSSTASTFNNAQIFVSNYTSSANKSFSVENVVENNSATNLMSIKAALWANTNAITSFKITAAGGYNLVQYSTASLYKIY